MCKPDEVEPSKVNTGGGERDLGGCSQVRPLAAADKSVGAGKVDLPKEYIVEKIWSTINKLKRQQNAEICDKNTDVSLFDVMFVKQMYLSLIHI